MERREWRVVKSGPWKRKSRPLLAAILVFGSWPAASQAAVLSLYDFTGLTSASAVPYAATSSSANVTAGNFTIGSGFGSNGNWNTTSSGIDTTGEGNLLPAYAQKAVTASIGVNQATAFSNNAYWTISLQPDSGYELDLTTLTFDIRTIGTSAGRTNFYLSSDAAGFATPIGSVTNSYSAGPGFSTISFDLSAAAFQDLTSPLQFRLYTWWDAGTGTGSGSSIRFDNIAVNGAVSAVPEPSTYMLLASGLGLLACLRRRKKV